MSYLFALFKCDFEKLFHLLISGVILRLNYTSLATMPLLSTYFFKLNMTCEVECDEGFFQSTFVQGFTVKLRSMKITV